MPIYEYHCASCGKDFECLVFGSENPDCPECHSIDVCKQLSVCGFVSKGKGGETVSKTAGASACGSCAATSCSSCGH